MEDFATPLKDAIEGVMDALAWSVPDLAARMAHGEESGAAVVSSSCDVSSEALSADAPAEKMRVVAKRCDFPTVSGGSTVWVNDAMRLVTSAKTDGAGISISMGLSDPLTAAAATYRRAGTAIWLPANVLALESDVLDPVSDALAPTTMRGWFVALSADDWTEATDPQIGDDLSLDGKHLRVSAVKRADGYFILTARERRT